MRLPCQSSCLIGIGALSISVLGHSSPGFEKEIAPLLEAKCLSCHHSGEAKGDFVLSTREEAFQLAGGIVPGEAEESLLFQVVSGADPEMPKKGKPLTEKQVALLRDWIDTGASWPESRVLNDNPERDLDWWSLAPLKDPRLGSSSHGNPVDSFIEAKLTGQQLTPVPEANAQTLIRRITYDLTGLPPTPEEIDHFLTASQTDRELAWGNLVDRLLSSPAFGEKFAQHWLDLARYAETHGYDKDKPRNNAWPYRDYVIRSLNDDKPYGRFVQEQVAGDVLFPNEPDAVTALGFLAAGPWDFIGHWEVGEGKLDGRIAKHLDRDEMISAVFNVFQSSTVQCAQCHHHKFDPVRMEDYYRLHAVFAAVDRADRVYDGLPLEDQKRKEELLSQINRLKQEQAALTTEVTRLIAAKASGLDRRISELKEKYGTGLKPQYGYHSQITKNQNEVKWVQLDFGKPKSPTEIRLIPAYDQYNNIGAGFGFPIRYRVEVSNDLLFQKNVRLLLDATGEDQPNPGTNTIVLNGDGNSFRFLRITATKLRERKADFIFALGEVEAVNEGGAANFAREALVTAKDSIEAPVRWGRTNLVDGIFFRELGNDKALDELQELQKRRAEIEKSVRPPGTDSRLSEIKTELESLQKAASAIPEGKLVYAAATHFPRGGRFTATSGTPRPIHLLYRGDLTTPGDLMFPGAPPLQQNRSGIFFPETEWNEGDARAELARYLTNRENPLVWRSIANRLWQWTFGKPLVGTPNDFGRGGMKPTHPELLDYLATTLRDDPGQSMKSLVRLLVTSRAYRRSSGHDEENAKVDAGNSLLWRFHRRRLTAEELRDSILAVSGNLDRSMGGPGFQDFVIEKPQHSPHYQYHLHDPNDPKSHRRTIYRFVVRSQPQPMLTTLDCADPSMSVPERDESTTALQALTQWNNRFVEAMSVNYAKKLDANDPEKLVTESFRQMTGRLPSMQEIEILSAHLKSGGTASYARVLMNLNAFVYVD
ncbi:MAG: DUF1553 domain-containing protein [Verrucomicrobiales bacterium]|nr:DUF1553 domain-containing protein [Verrucomicrobiales bacterium]